MPRSLALTIAFFMLASPAWAALDDLPLGGTKPLEATEDLAAKMVSDVKEFLLKKTRESVASRATMWPRDNPNDETRARRLVAHRTSLANMLGVRDTLVTQPDDAVAASNYVAASDAVLTQRFTWPAFADVYGEGLLVTSMNTLDPSGVIVIVPDADQTPETYCGYLEPRSPGFALAPRLAKLGYAVLVMPLVDRAVEARNGRAKMTTREFLHRSAFEMGRTVRGYEIQMLLSGASAVAHSKSHTPLKLGVIGYGEGGLVALEAAAIDPRIDAVLVSGAFESRLDTWTQPLDRNAFGLLQQFGGAELAAMIAPRPLVIEASMFPKVDLPPGTGGAPGKLTTPALDDIKAEVERARDLIAATSKPGPLTLITSGNDGAGPPLTDDAVAAFLKQLDPDATLGPIPNQNWLTSTEQVNAGIAARKARLVHALDRHTQQLLDASPAVRSKFMDKLDTSSPEAFARTVEPYRTHFYEQTIGKFDEAVLPANPRSRKIYETDKLTGYEVVLDMWDGVFAYGILVMPKEIKDGERRPVVVCQHGLEGRPRDLADPSVNNPAYNQYALRLAERGFITFAPQNLYIGEDKFRVLQRLANPLGKSLFSIIVPQHQQITDWLKTLPFVDDQRIAFYGLSYGGKSAMRIPPLVSNYVLSICSADFNEWVWKNASTRSPYSYVWTNEYEIFEWDLGSTFNYAEMAALIAPRPFMVERGHFDGVAPDETVAYEFAKVRFLYEAKLKLPADHTQLEWFVGPHTIHGVGTFEFLHHHLKWPSTQPITPLNKP